MLVEKIQHAATEDDTYLLRRAVHSLKGSSSNVGANNLVQHCLDVEQLLEDNDMPAAKLRLNEIEAEYQRVRQALIARRKIN